MLVSRPSRHILGFAALAAVLTACSDNPAGPSGSLDVSQVEQAHTEVMRALEVPALYSLVGSVDADAFAAPRTAPLDLGALRPTRTADGMRMSGATLHKAVRTALNEAGFADAAEPGELDSWYVDPGLWGDTYVKDADGFLEVDPNRTGAPDRGVRIALYQRMATGNFSGTIVGWLDVIDSSTTASMIGRVNVVSAAGATVATFRATSSETGATTLTVSETFTGTLGVAPRVITVADTISGTRAADGSSATLRWHSVSKAPFANVAYDLLATGYDDDSGEAADADLSITVGVHTTRIEGAYAVGSDDGVTNIYIDDDLVARITYDPLTEETEVTGPNGGEVPQRTQQYLGAVLLIAGTLPNALALHLVLAFMFILI